MFTNFQGRQNMPDAPRVIIITFEIEVHVRLNDSLEKIDR